MQGNKHRALFMVTYRYELAGQLQSYPSRARHQKARKQPVRDDGALPLYGSFGLPPQPSSLSLSSLALVGSWDCCRVTRNCHACQSASCCRSIRQGLQQPPDHVSSLCTANYWLLYWQWQRTFATAHVLPRAML